MDVTCRLIGPQEVRIDASYGRDDPVAGAVVRMLAPDGVRLNEGETDAAGTCLLALTGRGEYTFEVVHSGHRGTCTLPADAFDEVGSKPAAADGPAPENDRIGLAVHEFDVSGTITGLAVIFGLFALVLVVIQRKEIQRLQADLAKERTRRS